MIFFFISIFQCMTCYRSERSFMQGIFPCNTIRRPWKCIYQSVVNNVYYLPWELRWSSWEIYNSFRHDYKYLIREQSTLLTEMFLNEWESCRVPDSFYIICSSVSATWLAGERSTNQNADFRRVITRGTFTTNDVLNSGL